MDTVPVQNIIDTVFCDIGNRFFKIIQTVFIETVVDLDLVAVFRLFKND